SAELETLSRPPSPSAKAPADARPWKPVYDGKTNACINRACHNAWQIKDGFLCNVPGVDNAAQIRNALGDGELRLRLESRGNSAKAELAVAELVTGLRRVDDAG